MTFQITCCTETLLTFIANIRLHTFMSLDVFLKVTFAAEFNLTNVTRKPSSFIVWLQQMRLKRLSPSETFWTVSTWEFLCSSVNTDMRHQVFSCLERLATERTMIRSSVAMYTTFVQLHGATLAETFVAKWTVVWFFSGVDSHVAIQQTRRNKRLWDMSMSSVRCCKM